eukprot:1353090-Lingulodinium_polyedra.AAC.1
MAEAVGIPSSHGRKRARRVGPLFKDSAFECCSKAKLAKTIGKAVAIDQPSAGPVRAVQQG